MRLAVLLAAALSLAGCAKHRHESTSVTVSGGDGNTVATLDGQTGDLKLDLPGLQGKLTLPRIQVNADNFDLNGVHLYPGSAIRSLDIAGGTSKQQVRVAFTSPASPATVRDWLMTRLNRQAGFAVSAEGDGLVGTTDEHKPFRMTLTPAGANRASGTITIGA